LPIIGGTQCQDVTETPKHGDTFRLGDIEVKSLHTPCHTQDSICWFLQDGDQKAVFTGDTLFISGTCRSLTIAHMRRRVVTTLPPPSRMSCKQFLVRAQRKQAV